MSDNAQPPTLEARELTKRYGAFTAVGDVSFAVQPRQILGILGPNGAGKSTVVRMMTGLLEPSGGSVLFKGNRVRDHLTDYKQAVGYVPEQPELYGFLTGWEYLEMVATLRGLQRRNEAQRLCLSISVALGTLLAYQSVSSAGFVTPRSASSPPDTPILAAPLIMAYLLILGLRLAFEFPATLPANWTFQTSLNSREHDSRGVARRVIVIFLMFVVLLPTLTVFTCLQGFRVAVLQTSYVLALSLGLIEVLVSGYRKLPFTYPTPGFRDNLPMRCFLHVLGFAGFTRLGAEVNRWMLAEPTRFLVIAVVIAAAYFRNGTRIRNGRDCGEIEEGLSFDSRPSPTVLRLKLLDGD